MHPFQNPVNTVNLTSCDWDNSNNSTVTSNSPHCYCGLLKQIMRPGRLPWEEYWQVLYSVNILVYESDPMQRKIQLLLWIQLHQCISVFWEVLHFCIYGLFPTNSTQNFMPSPKAQRICQKCFAGIYDADI